MNFPLKSKRRASDETAVQEEMYVTVSQEKYTIKGKTEKTNVGFKYESQIKSGRKDDSDHGNGFMTVLLHTKATLATPLRVTAGIHLWSEG